MTRAARPARGALLIDAQLAALTLDDGATLCTAVRDVACFPKLRVRNSRAD
jgi:hypothetical protein